MYPHFIEITPKVTGGKVSVNIDNIVMFGDGQVVYTNMRMISEYDAFRCTESYEEIKKLIEASGCQITKSDPRLDTSKPLTMSDFDSMIGEPVWNSNLREWALVTEQVKSDDGYEFVSFKAYKNGGYEYDEDDIEKYPMYRMKQKDNHESHG